MPSAWRGKVRDLRGIIDSGEHVNVISDGFESIFQRPSPSEARSWDQSLPVVMNAISGKEFDDLKIILELAMPVGAERADMIIIGGTKEHPKFVVCELKQWSGFDLIEVTLEVSVPGIGYRPHPSLQALNYRGKLLFFSERGATNEIKVCVFAHNATSSDKNLLESMTPASWTAAAPIFTSDETEGFRKFVKNFLFPIEFECNEAELLDLSAYKQSNKLFEHLEKHGKEIANNVAEVLANTGMGLTEEQSAIENEVIRALESGESKHLIIQGGPGSGKTLLAIHLLLRATSKKFETIYALRNNRLQAILKKVLNESLPGLSGLTFYFNPRQGNSLTNHPGNLDLLICDEAQRMDKAPLDVTPQKARVSAIFLDETQRLNPIELGTVNNFSDSFKRNGKNVEIRVLSEAIRCSGGKPYHDWVESLLKEPSSSAKLKNLQRVWSQKYRLNVFSSIFDVINELKKNKSNEIRVALVASFTESPGVQGSPSAPDNLRIGYPLTSGYSGYRDININIPWLMATREYEKFWKDGMSNNLDRVASIYGSQGFETDFVGLIWGRDLLFRDGKWQLGNPDHCYDTIDRLVPRNRSRWCEGALQLIVNRYRIFLTRGIRGTFIFCEDDETLSHLMKIPSI